MDPSSGIPIYSVHTTYNWSLLLSGAHRVCIHTYIHTYIYTYTYIHTYIHTYKHTNIQTYKYTNRQTYILMCIYMYMRKCNTYAHQHRRSTPCFQTRSTRTEAKAAKRLSAQLAHHVAADAPRDDPWITDAIRPSVDTTLTQPRKRIASCFRKLLHACRPVHILGFTKVGLLPPASNPQPCRGLADFHAPPLLRRFINTVLPREACARRGALLGRWVT